MGDFLKNAGIVGMHYILDEIAAASEDLAIRKIISNYGLIQISVRKRTGRIYTFVGSRHITGHIVYIKQYWIRLRIC